MPIPLRQLVSGAGLSAALVGCFTGEGVSLSGSLVPRCVLWLHGP